MGPIMSSIRPFACIFLQYSREYRFKLSKRFRFKQRIMTEQREPLVSDQQQQPISEAFKLKLNFLQKNWQRAKDQNVRLNQKLLRMEQQHQALTCEKRSLQEKIQVLETKINRHDMEKEGLVRKLSLRTQRHQAQQSKNMSFEQKQTIKRNVRKSSAELDLFRDEQELLSRRNKALLSDLDNERSQNLRLREQLITLQRQNLQDVAKLEQVEKLFKQKIEVLESENVVLKQQLDSLIVEVKLFQNKRQIDELLRYQDRIGIDLPIKSVAIRGTAVSLDSDRRGQGSRVKVCGCECGCELQLDEKDELIELLKQRGFRLEGQLQGVKRRCLTLQNIICSSRCIQR